MPLQSRGAHGLEPLATGYGQSRVGQATVVWIIDALHQSVALEMIDEAGDITRRDVEPLGELAQRKLVLGRRRERKQDVETPLTQAMLLRPPVHQLMRQPGRQPQRRHRLERAHLLFREWRSRLAKRLPEPAVV